MTNVHGSQRAGNYTNVNKRISEPSLVYYDYPVPRNRAKMRRAKGYGT